ncbi:MAG: hypothetical protein M1831_006932 [Alyxoria varia]|nr:MAG: hypothetical protein M1831_006932 [Alyxoria varia]
MFSEYASRFLAQSQSRLSLNDQGGSRAAIDNQQPQANRGPSRGYLQRRGIGNPYRGAGSQVSRFPFASRISNNPAPLFYSATDEFREEDDGAEHDREVADFYALQQSRRDFGGARLSDSSEDESALDTSRSDHDRRGGAQGRAGPISASAQGIKSSWNGDQASSTQDLGNKELNATQRGDQLGGFTAGVRSTSTLAKSRGKLVDVNLDSTIHEADEDLMDDYEQPTADGLTHPPSLQQLRREAPNRGSVRKSKTLDSVNENSPFLSQSKARSPDGESESPISNPTPVKTQNYDVFWSTVFLIDMVAMLSTFFLVYLHTSAPKKSGKYGDTIYTTMHSSFYLLAIDTLVAVIMALVWLAALRSFVRPLVYLILAAVPIIAISFSLYPFASSFKGATHGKSIQDKAMRWISLLPGVFAIVWSYTAYRGRKSLDRAIGLLEFAMRILADSPILIAVGFATLGIVVAWTWIWMIMFTRVFLGGHFSSSKHSFVIDAGTWWLGVFFVFSYLWSLGVISGVQRATNAAATSQWYFYRNSNPAPSSQNVGKAAITHATTKIFGTICFSTLLSLLVRLPLLLLPGRISNYLSLYFYSFIPTSIATLTNPLSLTFAAIHSQPLTLSARGLSELSFVAPTSTTATTALTPRAFSHAHRYRNQPGSPSLLAYRLSKLLLHATRFITSLAFGFGGWVSTARVLPVEGTSVRGSLYAYVVGFVAGAIGWAVLGAMEGVLSGVLDAVVVCWGSEMQSNGFGQARFCREAGELLMDEPAAGS